MTRLIILLILVASLPVLPFIYKKAGTGRRWTRFYLCMAMQEKKRKGFVLVMDALILSVNFLMFRISEPDLWLVPGFESHPATKSCLRAAYFDCWYCYYSYLFRLIFFNSSKTFNTGASQVRLSGIKGSSSGLKAIRAGSDKSI